MKKIYNGIKFLPLQFPGKFPPSTKKTKNKKENSHIFPQHSRVLCLKNVHGNKEKNIVKLHNQR
jgi:hypothetical protein